MSTEAPSFDTARQELFYQLSAYHFVRVVGPCRIPDNARQNDAITFFHGTAVKLPPPVPPSDGDGGHGRSKVWFKKLSPQLASRTARFGPLVVHTHPDVIPDAGDLLMGKLVPNDRMADGRESKERLQVFYTHVHHLHRLLHLVVTGTSTSEQALAHELRVRRPVNKGVDDAWALARLILFGNVQVFADQHRGTLPERMRMKLSSDPLSFVYDTATYLEDMSVWDAFVKLVPEAQPPAPRTPAPPPMPIVRPLQLTHAPSHSSQFSQSYGQDDSFVGKRRKRRFNEPETSHQPETPPYSPVSPPRYYQPHMHHSAHSPPPPMSPLPPPPLSPFMPPLPPVPPLPPLPASPPPPLSPCFQAATPPPVDVYDEYDPYYPAYDAHMATSVPPTPTQYTIETVMSLLQAVNQVQSAGAAHP